MKYLIDVLDSDSLFELRYLVDTATQDSTSNIHGVSTDSAVKVNGTFTRALSVLHNQDLLTWLENNSFLFLKDILSLHTVSYRVGSCTKPHFDTNSASTVVFILHNSIEGGASIFNNKEYKYKEGSVLQYGGSHVLHGVSTVTKGFRKVLVIWFKHKQKTTLI